MYLIDFAEQTELTTRYLPCSCMGEDRGCDVCHGNGSRPISVTHLGVLLSDSLRNDLVLAMQDASRHGGRSEQYVWGPLLTQGIRALHRYGLVLSHGNPKLQQAIKCEFYGLISSLERLAERATAGELMLIIREVSE